MAETSMFSLQPSMLCPAKILAISPTVITAVQRLDRLSLANEVWTVSQIWV